MKKKIGILTFSGAINYGAVLQEYALCKKINYFGYDAEIINYLCEKIQNERKFINLDAGSPKIFLKSIAKSLLTIKQLPFKKHRILKFEKENIKIADKISSKRSIDFNEYNKIIVGSDQVWNLKTTGHDNIFYLADAPKSIKRYSYAASFGEYRPTRSEWQIIKGYLKKFNTISVREDSAKNMLSKNGVTGAIISLDPTLLLTRTEWEVIAKKPKEKHYILIYNVRRSNRIYEAARKLKNQTGLPIIDLSGNLALLPKKSTKSRPNVSPSEFVGYFLSADYILTTSFHGCAFSIISEKPFLLDPTSNKGEKNDRAINLLRRINLLNRRLDINDIDKIKETIDWQKVSKKLRPLINKSTKYLKDICKA